jgi:hypothetical protein
MSSLNNGVGNIKGTPAMITDVLTNRPSASNLAVGTIFIDRLTGNWYQVGTNNTWSSTGGGGGGGSQDLAQVLAIGSTAENQNITLTNPDNASAIVIDQDNNYWLQIYGDSGNTQTQITPNGITMYSNGDETTTTLNSNGYSIKPSTSDYPVTYFFNDQVKTVNSNWELALLNNRVANVPAISFDDKIHNCLQYIAPRSNGTHDDFTIDKVFGLPYNNRGLMSLATADICPAPNNLNIDLSTGDKTPDLFNEINQCYFIITTGSLTNGIVLNSSFTSACTYHFLNKATIAVNFKITTGGVIYGSTTITNKGLILITKLSNDFYINQP